MTAIIQCRSLSKSFSGIQAINQLDLDIEQGTSAGLVGPNGAGKTTLFSLFCGFLRPDHGDIKILGHNPNAGDLKGRIGVLPQDVPLSKGISVRDQLVFFARLQGMDKKSARQEVDQVLSLTQANELAKQIPETLSYGQRKKVTLAQALINKPELLLLDEPTSGLDPVAADHVRSIIQTVREKYTCIISSHNLDEIKNICNEIIVINKGRLVEQCQIEDLLARNNIVSVLLEDEPTELLLNAIREISSVTSLEIDRSSRKRLMITIEKISAKEFQKSLLNLLHHHDAYAIEIGRGNAFSDEVIKLVNNS